MLVENENGNIDILTVITELKRFTVVNYLTISLLVLEDISLTPLLAHSTRSISKIVVEWFELRQ
jgi:hypothetical protein